MAKDPAFLFYSKDWLEGTAEMTPEEKGVYIDLLAHQHQKGSLPAEPKRMAKLVGLPENEFSRIWSDISSKFIANASGRMVNRKLDGIVSERLDKGWRSTIVGTLGATVRYAIQKEGKNPEIAEKVKKTFKVDDFLACSKDNLSERVSIWFSERYDLCYKSIANEDANSITNSKEPEIKSLGSEFVKGVAKAVWEDKGWIESICMGQTLQPDEIARWMAQFNSSICNDSVPGFGPPSYKKMFLGWINKQRGKGYKLPEKQLNGTSQLRTLD